MRDLSVATNPHLKPEDAKKLPRTLEDRYQKIVGVQVNHEEFDPKALEAFKKRLGQESPGIGVK